MKKIILLFTLILGACGTLFNSSNQDVSFDSNIKGVKVYVDGLEICKTPCVYPMERKSGTTIVTAKKTGYDDKQIIIRSNLSAIAVLNLTFWPSWLTDVATGGMWQYNKNGVYIDMEKSNLKSAELKQIKKDVAVSRFALFNYSELKIEAATQQKNKEYISSLSELSGLSEEKLTQTINKTTGAVNLAHVLTNITTSSE